MCHSIPDGVGLGIHTPVGMVVHTGDFKLDQTPIDCRLTAMQRFAELGSKGVLLLLSDSTNADVSGLHEAGAERGENLDSIFALAPGRIIVASFASHIHRIQQVMDTAHASRPLRGHHRPQHGEERQYRLESRLPDRAGRPSGEAPRYQPAPLGQAWPSCPRAAKGSHCRPWPAWPRSEHPLVEIIKGDTVIISARPVPGNETSVNRTIDRLFAAGARVIYESSAGVHVSGHAAAEELKVMLNLVRPRFFMPIHGEHRHLYFHAELARATGWRTRISSCWRTGTCWSCCPNRRRSRERCRRA